jgi:hypothetical protein
MLRPVSRPDDASSTARPIVPALLASRVGAACAALFALLATGCAKEDAPSVVAEREHVAVTAEPLSATDTVTLVASRDTSIVVRDPNRNFGNDPVLEVNRALVGFDQTALRGAVASPGDLVSASLELTLSDNDVRRRSSPRVASLFRLTRAWTENGATWNCAIDARPSNNRPNCSGATQWSMDVDPPNPWAAPATDTATVAARQTGIIDFDVTSDVRGFLDGSVANEGWMVMANSSADFAEFASRETRTPPVLVLAVRRCNVAACDDGNACTVDACDTGGQCKHTPVADGTVCSDGNACTQVDSCRAGACVGSNPVICAASDQCHAAGTCDPTTGACSNPAAPDGAACSDGNACTQVDSCQAGACVGSSPVGCTASDQCHAAGTCDPTTGACSNPAAPDGAACSDGNACTQVDSCQTGACVGSSPVICTASDQCHAAGTCDPTTGACSNPAAPDGTACNDGNGCTLGDACAAGVCASGAAKTCPAGSDGCHPGVCEPATGTCSNPLACQLIGKGSVPASAQDGLDVRPITLPDGTPHNQIGGFGSAIAYTGVGNLYLTQPDRGPNNGSVPFVDRYYQVELTVANGIVTTLFRGGATLDKAPGDPFVGLDSAFDATGSPDSHRLDPEGLRVSPRGTFFTSDEYGPYLYEFDASGNRLRSLAVPAKFLVKNPGIEDAELPPTNTSGRLDNRGMEGLAITPDGSKLYGIMQSPLIQDAALNSSNKRVGTNNRILEVDVDTGATREFLYQMDSKDYGVNEILAVNDHQFLVLERDGDGGTAATFKRLFFIDIAGATDISNVDSLPRTGTPAGVVPVSKTPFLDLLAPTFGLAGPAFPEKLEGIAFGPDQPDGSHLLIVTQDNDFLADQPSQIYAFSIAPAALPGFQAQSATFSDKCVTPSPITCPASGPCTHDGMCNPGTASCTPPTLPAGTVAGTQVPGDCQELQCDGNGALVSVPFDADVPPDDTNQCTTEICSGGVASHPLSAAGTACNQSGGAKCDGAGACVACLVANDCPGVDADCARRTCVAGACGTENIAAGTVVATQAPGDCRQNQCDGNGNVTAVADDTDVPFDNNPCTIDVCAGGVASNPAAPPGFACGGGNVCDGAGACIGCITASDCPGADTECAVRTCSAGVCGTTFAPANTRTSAQTPGDCRANVCDGNGNVVSVNDDADTQSDGNACTLDTCASGVATFPSAPAGTPCKQSGGNACDGSGACVTAFMVVRMGSPTLPQLKSSASAVFVDQIDLTGRTLRTIPLPTVTSGAQRRFVNSGQAGSEGALAMSPHGKYLTLGGYDAAPGTASIASSASATTPRVVARIDAAGNIDTTTTITDSFSGNNIRGAVTDDTGSQFWASGPSGGVRFVTLGGTTSTLISTGLTNTRTVQIFEGQLYGSSNSGAFSNVFTVGIGVPTTPALATDIVSLPGFPKTSGPSPYAFVFIGTTLYVADDRATGSPVTAGGGIQKWTLRGGLFSLQTTFTTGLGGFGVRGLTGFASGSNVVLIATTAETLDPSGQRIVTLTDTGAGDAPATTIVTGSLNVAYRGVTLPFSATP